MRAILIALIGIMAIPCCVSGQEERLAIKQDKDDPSRYVCDVKFATFRAPSDWRPNRSDKNTYAILTHIDESYPNITEMISIDIGKPTERTAKLTAEAFAKTWNGKLLVDKVPVDGEEGYRVTIDPTKKLVRPVDCVVVFKGDSVFMLIGGAKENKSVSTSIDEIVASWKWRRGDGEEIDGNEQ
jgi:hypothetical protein